MLVNNHLGAHLAVTHLLENDYRRIGFIAGPSDISTANQRRAGYCSALVDHGVGMTEDLVAMGDFFAPSGYAAATAILTSDKPADALFVANGQMAAGAYAAVLDLGLSIPGDLGFATFDDDLWMTLVDPSITVVRQPAYELGEAAADVLLRRERATESDANEIARQVLAPELIVRASSAGPATEKNGSAPVGSEDTFANCSVPIRTRLTCLHDDNGGAGVIVEVVPLESDDMVMSDPCAPENGPALSMNFGLASWLSHQHGAGRTVDINGDCRDYGLERLRG